MPRLWLGPLSTEIEIDLAATGARVTAGAEGPWADPFLALDRLGVVVLRWPLKNAVEGIYTRSEGECFAVVNSLTEYVRQRFTAAHELGHHVLYRDGESPAVFSDVNLDAEPDDAAGEESEADGFAVAFLMPRGLVAEIASEFEEEDRQVVAVMAAFEVSRKSAARRCHQLGLVSADTLAGFEKDRRRIPDLFALVGQTQPDRTREKGVRVVDSRLRELVALLAKASPIVHPEHFLDLTPRTDE